MAVIVQLTITAWLALEAGLIIRDRVRGKGGFARDRGTLWLNIIVITVALGVAGTLTASFRHSAWQFGSSGLSVAGPIIMWIGLVVRIWAIVVLGQSFRTTVEVDAGQQVVDSGPYRWVRHPSYTGILLLMVGLSLVYGNSSSRKPPSPRSWAGRTRTTPPAPSVSCRACGDGRLFLDADPRAEFGALTDLAHDARGGDVEDVHGQRLLVGQHERTGVHDPNPGGQRLVVG
jgi:protein-S-isoprenylcysteine O-methyltransferase Ste14